jgi:putative metalloenzyme radical SAM/SPASM domain maturase
MAEPALQDHTPTEIDIPPARRDFPSKLFLEPTTRCNLRCRMCVKQSRDCDIDEGDMSFALLSSILPALPRLDAVIVSGIGEPLLHPRLTEMLRLLDHRRGPNTRIGLQTNGTLLGAAMARDLVKSGLDRICLSMDAVSPETFSAIRQGGRMETVQEACRHLVLAKKESGRDRLSIGMELVLMDRNLADLPAAVRHMASLGVDFVLVTQLLAYDPSHSTQVAYGANTDASRALFSKWQRLAVRDGIDLSDYYAVLRRFYKSRTEKEWKLYHIVEKMQDEAREKGIPLDIKSLIAQDPVRLQTLARIFEKAGDTAARCGIALHLPAFEARKERRCVFVEEGGAFVNWKGEVHPCYFTWHRYTCHINGRKKFVQPKVFGNLTATCLETIWNAEDFRRFRNQVLSYDYPYCGNCTFAPCDYIGTASFSHDCHTLEVPCGDCPWCDGLLQCLA